MHHFSFPILARLTYHRTLAELASGTQPGDGRHLEPQLGSASPLTLTIDVPRPLAPCRHPASATTQPTKPM
jgi:hypothetical protein